MTEILEMTSNYEEYLMDESKYTGHADSISFPESEDEIVSIIQKMKQESIPITIQGGKTGITGGAVPSGGHIMNMSRMNRCLGSEIMTDGTGRIRVEPGMNLMDLSKEIDKLKASLFWPPDPTESSATIGGIAAANAKGPNQYMYGDTKQYIHGVRLVTCTGEVLSLTRSDDEEKLDRLLGSEGITGVYSEITLNLYKKPDEVWGIGFFFESDEDASNFIEEINTIKNIASAEYLDRLTINMIEKRKPYMTKIKELPDVEPDFVNAVLIELHGTEEEIESAAEQLMEHAMNCNGDPDKAWAVTGEMENEKMKAFRHAAAEASNLYVEEMRFNDKRITKLATDMTVKDMKLIDVMRKARMDLEKEGIDGAIFGHVFENHLHINLFPSSFEQYQRGIELIKGWMFEVCKHDGKIVSEHGIGKLKRELYQKYGSKEYLKQCENLKAEFDPDHLFNRGNIERE